MFPRRPHAPFTAHTEGGLGMRYKNWDIKDMRHKRVNSSEKIQYELNDISPRGIRKKQIETRGIQRRLEREIMVEDNCRLDPF